MNATLELVRANLLSPMFLAFALGFVARRMKSDLSFPEGMVSGLSTYLLFAIGLEGGGALAKAGFSAVALPAAGTLVLGVLTPVLGAMAASASYIAAPAAVRIALPKADPGLYLTSAVGITFPFNLAVGLPIYLAVARALVPERAGALATLLL